VAAWAMPTATESNITKKKIKLELIGNCRELNFTKHSSENKEPSIELTNLSTIQLIINLGNAYRGRKYQKN
jgi:hypothetical protein